MMKDMIDTGLNDCSEGDEVIRKVLTGGAFGIYM